MSERHPVEKSPPYHVAIWIIVGIVTVAIVYGLVQRANVPPAGGEPAGKQLAVLQRLHKLGNIGFAAGNRAVDTLGGEQHAALQLKCGA